MKPYHQVKIEECSELLVLIPLDKFAVESPHPYERVGAKYGDASPYCLRLSVLHKLMAAQEYLQQIRPGWLIKIFDAYRPVEVQQFMVDYTFNQLCESQGLKSDSLSSSESQTIWHQVFQIWAVPNYDPNQPPPHSTGAAVDITLVDAEQNIVDMGSEIDELNERSHPHYYANSSSEVKQQYHARRELLNQIMMSAGFYRHPQEWWHFSWGDQMWTWQHNQKNPDNLLTARYGRVEHHTNLKHDSTPTSDRCL